MVLGEERYNRHGRGKIKNVLLGVRKFFAAANNEL